MIEESSHNESMVSVDVVSQEGQQEAFFLGEVNGARIVHELDEGSRKLACGGSVSTPHLRCQH